jgi:protein arginine kinase activator
MTCEICQQNAAEMAIRQTVPGQERELFVCGACAERGRAAASDGQLVEMLLGADFEVRRANRQDPVCPGCGLTRFAYRQRSRLGCERCYEAFARELQPLLRDMHRGATHAGKVPSRERQDRATAQTEAALRDAVAAQRFEDAARLRDRLRALRKAGPQPGGAGEPC